MGVLYIGLLVGYAVVQVVTMVVLLRRLIRRPEVFSKKARGLLMSSLAILPVPMLLLNAAAFCSDWKGDKGLGVFGVLDEDWAGLVGLPLWVVGAVYLVCLLARPQRLWTSRPGVLVLATMAFISLWHTLRTAMPEITQVCSDPVTALMSGLARLVETGGNGGGRIGEAALYFYLVAVPGMLTLNLLLLIAHVLQRRKLAGRFWAFALTWLTGLATTVAAKVLLAFQHYASLADQPPDNCFIVSAAATGHRRLVGRRAGADGRIDNLQLRRFRALEGRLRTGCPALHARLRRVYNRLAPPVARVVAANPLLADATYLALKPLEWLAAMVLHARSPSARG